MSLSSFETVSGGIRGPCVSESSSLTTFSCVGINVIVVLEWRTQTHVLVVLVYCDQSHGVQ